MYNEYMYDSYLEDAGLSEDQVKVYSYLLKSGPRQAGQISIGTNLSRTFVYKVLEQLTNLSLVVLESKEKVNRYTVTHPTNLIDLLEKKIKEKENARQSLQSVIGSMTADYNSFSNKPSVKFFEGKEGLQTLYDDIIHENKDIYLLRSPFDVKFSLEEMVLSQIERQVSYNIHTKAITPNVFKSSELSDDMSLSTDVERLTTRRMVPKDKLNLPAQVILYGNKVGITSYKKGIYTTIIDNKDIHETFRKVFDYVWEKTDSQDAK